MHDMIKRFIYLLVEKLLKLQRLRYKFLLCTLQF